MNRFYQFGFFTLLVALLGIGGWWIASKSTAVGDSAEQLPTSPYVMYSKEAQKFFELADMPVHVFRYSGGAVDVWAEIEVDGTIETLELLAEPVDDPAGHIVLIEGNEVGSQAVGAKAWRGRGPFEWRVVGDSGATAFGSIGVIEPGTEEPAAKELDGLTIRKGPIRRAGGPTGVVTFDAEKPTLLRHLGVYKRSDGGEVEYERSIRIFCRQRTANSQSASE